MLFFKLDKNYLFFQRHVLKCATTDFHFKATEFKTWILLGLETSV